jgi:hypothetical protein
MNNVIFQTLGMFLTLAMENTATTEHSPPCHDIIYKSARFFISRFICKKIVYPAIGKHYYEQLSLQYCSLYKP